MSNKDFRVKNGLVVEQDAVVLGTVTASNFIGSSAGLTGLYTSSNFNTDLGTKTTSNLAEGSNLYYTDVRARAALSATGRIGYNSSTGALTFDAAGLATESYVTSGLATKANLGANSDITSLSGITGGITTPDYVTFDTGITPTVGVGKLQWDPAFGTLQFGLAGGNVNLQVGQEQVALVFNAESTTLTDGTVVYLFGAQGGNISVKRATASGELTSTKTFGVVTEPIAAGQLGFVTRSGVVNGLNMSAYTSGDVLWLSTTPGQFTSTRPTAPNHTVFVGVVLKDNAGNGALYVAPQNGYELDELHNVVITSVANNQTLAYDLATGVWKNVSSLSLANLTLSGNLTVNGTTTTINTEQLSVTDSMIYLADGSTANVNDIGIVGAYDDGTYQHSGLVRDATDGKWKLFSNVTTEPTTVVDFTSAEYDTLKVGVLEASSFSGVTTDGLTEGTTNLYYTNARTRTAISGDGGISYNSSTGVITNAGVVSINALTGAITATNLLDAVKTVDGAASGLDADLLDGQHASYYTNEAINNAIALSIALG